MPETITNAKEYPKIYYCRHMLPGICGYENEHILVDADAMKQAAPSMIGKPIYVQHQKVDLQNIHEADGFVTECFYNELDGWLWAKMLVISDEGQQAIARKWSVSNAYNPLTWSEEGQHLNVDYNRKIRNYEFTHLAIVPNPRYEEALIFTPEEFKAYQAAKKAELEELQNSKPDNKEIPAMKFFRNKKEEIKAGDTIADSDFTEITNSDGSVEIVTVAELKEAKRLEKSNSKKNEKMVDDDEEIEVDGERVNMGDLKECYKNMKKNGTKKNEDDAEKEKKEKEAKENADKEEAEKKAKDEKEKEEKANSAKHFKELQNAQSKSKAPVIELQMDKFKRGEQRYGSVKK